MGQLSFDQESEVVRGYELEDVPARPLARTSDPETSHQAAGSIRLDRLRTSQAAVLRMFTDAGIGLTDVRAAELYDALRRQWPDLYPRQSPSGLRTRRDELVTAGLLEDSGERQRLPSGRMAIVWRLKTS